MNLISLQTTASVRGGAADACEQGGRAAVRGRSDGDKRRRYGQGEGSGLPRRGVKQVHGLRLDGVISIGQKRHLREPSRMVPGNVGGIQDIAVEIKGRGAPAAAHEIIPGAIDRKS